ncbi:hypothetical protein [Lactovum miscens]|uniref:SRPBCC family protein n=1 Tax=Lactovum miscens TaxID=190387 RepID=A0A841CBK8_9LACT|nr:hypothetical protein [Lactovum miscens]MBB5888560.1 hypothetical protein [Lactovum miscens]
MTTTINVEINQSFVKAYEYLQNPLNLSNWVSFFHKISQDENGLNAETSLGPCDLAFVAPNDYGVIDYVVRDERGQEYYNPMRVLQYDEKTLLTFTTWSDESDTLERIKSDLAKLKGILEK